MLRGILLRGIDVGGKNVISKGALSRCFEDLGLYNVRTYIQSGNILFRNAETDVGKLTNAIQAELSDRLSVPVQAVVLAYKRYRSAAQAAPDNWGKNDDQRHNALLALSGTTAERILAQLTSPKTDIESVTTGPGVIFWSVAKQPLTRTTLMKLPAALAYQQVTVRNHHTVFKLLELFEEMSTSRRHGIVAWKTSGSRTGGRSQ